MLEVQGIHTYYGLSHILFNVSLKVQKGQVVCLLGRNGAGKTTTLKSIMGLAPPSRGRVRLNGENVTGAAPYRLARRGIGYVPDDRRIFADLTVGENLEIAARPVPGPDGWTKERVYELFPPLKPMDSRKGGLLSGGEQKLLAIARALMTNPQLLLLDEPTEGLDGETEQALMASLDRLMAGRTVILITHRPVGLEWADQVLVLDQGRVLARGDASIIPQAAGAALIAAGPG